jgi:hypothetical protein
VKARQKSAIAQAARNCAGVDLSKRGIEAMMTILTHRSSMGRLLPVLLVLAATGCGPRHVLVVPDRPESPSQAIERRTKAARPTYNLAGYPPAVREGYIDGCETAKQSEFARKDARRFAADPQYEMGWNDGFGICKRVRP